MFMRVKEITIEEHFCYAQSVITFSLKYTYICKKIKIAMTKT